MFVYPEQIGEVIARFPAVSAWRAVVGRDPSGLDTFTIEVAGDADPDKIAEGIRGIVRLRADVVRVEALPPDTKPLEDRRV
jgi:hypothetical protein